MALVSGGTVFGLNFESLQAAQLIDYDFSTLTPTSARFFDDASNFTLFQGFDLTYFFGFPVSGTVTSIQYIVGGSTVLQVTGFSVPVSVILGFVSDNDAIGLLGVVLAGADTLTGTPLADVLYGFGGNDTLIGNAGNDTLNGGSGNDTLRGGLGADTLDGGVGLDTADYSDWTGAVAVTLNGATNATVTVGGIAEDTIRNIENVTGGRGADTLTGDGLANILIGNAGNDTLNGGSGNDTLKGGLGADTLSGGVGNDTFQFNTALGVANVDIISDFSVPNDTIELENAIFTAFAATGGMSLADFTDHIVYNSGTGALSYDANGVGTAGGVTQFATLAAGLALTNADFWVA
ncbi:MAG: hypothetical protein H0T56_18125 [Pseudaminobacter sp.]|nr:hypothetical protein [Pseudaminobacter sp.]